MRRYGQATAPLIPLENIQGFPVALLCGETDHLSQKRNYTWLKIKLEEQKSLTYFKEYKFGHLSFMLP